MPDFLADQGLLAQMLPGRPLSGVTLLLVEDSRYASEALRLLCLRSGARIRRADSLRSAERHLATYRPSVIVVDVGLPDGSGLDLVRKVATATPRLAAILATSGDDSYRNAAIAAGADGFLSKPLRDLQEFQRTLCAALGRGPVEQGSSEAALLLPDPLAYRDDLSLVSGLLSEDASPSQRAYAARFLKGVAASANDRELSEAAASLSAAISGGSALTAHLARVSCLVEDRLASTPADRRIAG